MKARKVKVRFLWESFAPTGRHTCICSSSGPSVSSLRRDLAKMLREGNQSQRDRMWQDSVYRKCPRTGRSVEIERRSWSPKAGGGDRGGDMRTGE